MMNLLFLSQEQQTVNPFVIYNPRYSELRECVSGAVYGKQFQQLTESIRVGVASKLQIITSRLWPGIKYTYCSI